MLDKVRTTARLALGTYYQRGKLGPGDAESPSLARRARQRQVAANLRRVPAAATGNFEARRSSKRLGAFRPSLHPRNDETFKYASGGWSMFSLGCGCGFLRSARRRGQTRSGQRGDEQRELAR